MHERPKPLVPRLLRRNWRTSHIKWRTVLGSACQFGLRLLQSSIFNPTFQPPFTPDGLDVGTGPVGHVFLLIECHSIPLVCSRFTDHNDFNSLPLYGPQRPKDRAILKPQRATPRQRYFPAIQAKLLHLMCTAADQQPTPVTHSLIRRLWHSMGSLPQAFFLLKRSPPHIRPLPSSVASCNPLAIFLATLISFVSLLAVLIIRNIFTLAPNPP